MKRFIIIAVVVVAIILAIYFINKYMKQKAAEKSALAATTAVNPSEAAEPHVAGTTLDTNGDVVSVNPNTAHA